MLDTDLEISEELAAKKILAEYDFDELCKAVANSEDPEPANVLVDLMAEKGAIDLDNAYHQDLVQALERSTERIRGLALLQAKSFAQRRLMSRDVLPSVPGNPYGDIHPTADAYEGFLNPLLNTDKKAADKGCVVVRPKENELFLDFDEVHQWNQFVGKNWPIFRKYFDPKATHKLEQSQSGKPGHIHITISLSKPVSALERILFQAVLGSDPVRELLSLVRLYYNLPDPTLFFEKDTAKEVKEPNYGQNYGGGFY